MRSRTRSLILALLMAALLALAAGAAGRVYRGPLFDLLTGGAAVAAVGIGALLARRPQWIVAPLSVLAMLAYAVFAVWWSAGAAGLAGPLAPAIGDAVRNSGPRLLTALVPVEAQPDTVLLPVVLVWVAGLVVAELAVRAGRVTPGLIPPVVVYLAALIYAGPHGVEPIRAAAFVALAAAAVALATPRAPALSANTPDIPARKRAPLRSGLRARAALGLFAFVALAALVVPAVAVALPDRPADPRTAVSPPQSDTLDEDPLARISGWMQNPSEPLFDVTLSAAARLTLAVLSDFDGVTWQIGAKYRDAGRVLPAPSAPIPGVPVTGGKRVSSEITIRDLRGRLVPAITAPRGVDGVRVAFDEGSGTLLRDAGLVGGTRYSVDSMLPGYDPNLLPAADVPSGQPVARFLGVGRNVPPEMQKLADAIVDGVAGPYQRAYALERFLAEHYQLTKDAPSGHSYPNLKFFLLASKAQGGQKGTSEQFAASYAVLGRLLGLPTRVVVGFTAPAGASTVTGANALAWPEVLFKGLGWVRFNPLPDSGTPQRPLEQDYHPKPDPPTPSEEPSTVPPALPSRSASASPTAAAARSSGSALPPWTPFAAGGGVLALLLLGQIGVVVARSTRSRRRMSTGSPSERVRGAWLEVLDGLRLAGRPPAYHLTVTDVAAWAERLPARGRTLPPLSKLAELVNMVGFAREWADDADAAVAAGQARDYLRALRAGRRLWRRMRWTLSPGPLLWRHGAPARPGAPRAREGSPGAGRTAQPPAGQVRPSAPPAW